MKHTLLLAGLMILAACSDGNGNGGAGAASVDAPVEVPPENAVFDISVTNLTLAQPLSPLAVVVHSEDSPLFTVGQAASIGLEELAESGDNNALLAENSSAITASGNDIFGPGVTETLSIELSSNDVTDMRISVLSMLVNTNDAFIAVNGADLSILEVGDSLRFNGNAYDSGTEANSETADTVPGPVGGGQGFNAQRDDIRDQVTLHAGVVTGDDGLASSDLMQQHRWDNPVARFVITRSQ